MKSIGAIHGLAHPGPRICRNAMLLLSCLMFGPGARPGPSCTRASPGACEIARATVEDGGTRMHIVYRLGDATNVALEEGEVSFDAPLISEDHLSVAWTAERFIDASYTIPADPFVYRRGKAMPAVYQPKCEQGGVAGDFYFAAQGRQIVIVSAFPHGIPHASEALFDVDTGKCLGTADMDPDTGKPLAHAPNWAR